ncbi:MAG: LysR family transcriptional regulator [Pseudolabrys sp.]|nr:LysR family transcriptional regulator [Pseudolabrys sp.]MCW5684691.1 LysR family transcriptional regulator [Pseudolabrys sp.]
MNFTLKQLRYFVLSAELKSVTRASQKANISQPSISAAIAELEAALDTKLFTRHHAKGLSLTAIGHQVFAEAKRLLAQADRFGQMTNEFVKGLSGTLEVGCLLTLAPLVMPSLMKSIRAHYPNLTVGCRELDVKEVVEGLREGAFEIAITYNLNLEADISFYGVRSFPPYALLSRQHPLTQHARVNLRMLADEPMILLDLPYTRDYFQSIFESAGIAPNIVYRTTSPQMVRSMVASGMGYSILNARPPWRHSFDDHQYAIVELSERLPTLRMGLVHLKDHVFTRAAQIVIKEFEMQNTGRRLGTTDPDAVSTTPLPQV